MAPIRKLTLAINASKDGAAELGRELAAIATKAGVTVREIAAQPEFPHVVVNDRLERAVEELADIVQQSLQAA